jgi:hypothetical protein
MIVQKSFVDDLKYLAARYEWNAEDKDDVRAAIKDCQPMVRYFTVLAAAHRAGYSQDAGNGFVRLKDWCLAQGLDDPYNADFDPAALDALHVEQRAPA